MAQDPKPKTGYTLTDLIRRPIEYGLIGASAVLVIALADTLQVLPLKLKGLGTEVEFSTREKETLNSTAAQIAQLEAKVEKLQGELARVVQEGTFAVSAEAILEAPEDRGNVSAAILSREEELNGEGIVWLGTFDPATNRWSDRSVVEPGGKLAPPDALEAREVLFSIDVNLREAFPERDDTYYDNISKLGVVSEGARGTILGPPQLYSRASGEQYWARIQTTYTPAEN